MESSRCRRDKINLNLFLIVVVMVSFANINVTAVIHLPEGKISYKFSDLFVSCVCCYLGFSFEVSRRSDVIMHALNYCCVSLEFQILHKHITEPAKYTQVMQWRAQGEGGGREGCCMAPSPSSVKKNV